MEYPASAIRPPEKVDTPYNEAVNRCLWPYDDISPARIMAGEWPLSFCTDDECSRLSGVPERSLRLLQTAGVIHATKAPLSGGSFKRVWHLPEAAVATSLECLKRVTNVDYKTTAEISLHVAKAIRLLFVEFVKMQNDDSKHLFGANLMLSHNQNLYMQVSHAVARIPPIRSLIVGDNNVMPIASLTGIKSKLIDPSQRAAMAAAFEHSRFHAVVTLGNVFPQFEQQARTLRAP